MVPTLEDLMRGAASADWSWFEDVEKRMGQQPSTETEALRSRLAAAASRIFDTDDGRLVLQTLVDVTLLRSIFVTQIGIDPMQAYAFGAFREGQNALATQLLRLIAEGRGEAPPQPRENM